MAPALLLVILLTMPLVLMAAVLPMPVVLPVFSIWSIAVAIAVALFALFRGVRLGWGVTAWDVAGAFTLIGCAAAIFGELEPLVEYVRPMTSRNDVND